MTNTLNKNKIISYEKLYEIIENLKRSHIKISFVNGCFDIIHAGHISLFNTAKINNDACLIVAINSDDSVKRIKGNDRPINNELERSFILSAISYIDYVIIFDEPDPVHLLNIIKPDYYVKGVDWSFDKLLPDEQKAIKNNNIMLLNIPLMENRSTTNIIEKIKRSSDE